MAAVEIAVRCGVQFFAPLARQRAFVDFPAVGAALEQRLARERLKTGAVDVDGCEPREFAFFAQHHAVVRVAQDVGTAAVEARQVVFGGGARLWQADFELFAQKNGLITGGIAHIWLDLLVGVQKSLRFLKYCKVIGNSCGKAPGIQSNETSGINRAVERAKKSVR